MTISTVFATSSWEIASATARSGKWVVTNATFIRLLASIITTLSRPDCCIKNSVCPIKSGNTVIITDFCSGAVTIAATCLLMASLCASCSCAMTICALWGFSCPATTGCAVGTSTTKIVSCADGCAICGKSFNSCVANC